MATPRALIFSGYGLNCEEETKFAFEQGGAIADIVHINDLIDGTKKLSNYQIMAFPGGFSYGDDTGSGNAFANKLRHHLWDEVLAFVNRETLTLGICNGFQIIANLGLVPAINKEYGKRQVALVHNDNARYTVRWVDLEVGNDCPWLAGIDRISLPIAHGEGKLFADPTVRKELEGHNLVALRYVQGEICQDQDLPANPNGSIDKIAGLTDESGRILGMMPHPERAVEFTQLPGWPLKKERMGHLGDSLPEHGPGLDIFKNAVTYFK